MFDIDLYTKLVIAANQYKDLNFLTKDDLYDFIELDNDFKTGIVQKVTPDLDVESLDPEEYADKYTDWIAEAVIQYENMRDEYNMKNKKYYEEQMTILENEIQDRFGPLNWCDQTVYCTGRGSIGFTDDGEGEDQFFKKMAEIKEYIKSKGYTAELIKFDEDKDHNYYEAIINFHFEGGEL